MIKVRTSSTAAPIATPMMMEILVVELLSPFFGVGVLVELLVAPVIGPEVGFEMGAPVAFPNFCPGLAVKG